MGNTGFGNSGPFFHFSKSVMKRFLLLTAVALILSPRSSTGQEVADSSMRLTYRIEKPQGTALDLAMKGLGVSDGEFVSVYTQSGDSIAGIVARVRDGTWARNRGLMSNGGRQIDFGPIRTYLRHSQLFRIFVLPAWCSGCEGDRRVNFLPYEDTTGYMFGGKRQRVH